MKYRSPVLKYINNFFFYLGLQPPGVMRFFNMVQLIHDS